MSVCCAVIAVLQGAQPQTPYGAIITAVGVVIVALITAIGAHWSQSKRFERIENDVTLQTRRLEKLESDVAGIGHHADAAAHDVARLASELATWSAQGHRLESLETDLILFLTTKDTAKVTRVLLDALTERLGVEPTKAVTLAIYLRRVADDEMMRRMTELYASRRAEDVKKEYEDLKRKLTDAGEEEEYDHPKQTD